MASEGRSQLLNLAELQALSVTGLPYTAGPPYIAISKPDLECGSASSMVLGGVPGSWVEARTKRPFRKLKRTRLARHHTRAGQGYGSTTPHHPIICWHGIECFLPGSIISPIPRL